jgi:putative DNA primase/helicase
VIAAPAADPLELEPVELPLSQEARRIWINYLNICEAQMAPHGEFADVRDVVASKSAENACRLAAIFHLWTHGPEGEIGAEDMARGARVAEWYLLEARRVLGLREENEVAQDAYLMAEWIGNRTEEHKTPPFLSELTQLGPYRLRDKRRRGAAMSLLVAKNWLRQSKRDGKTVLVLNPRADVVTRFTSED